MYFFDIHSCMNVEDKYRILVIEDEGEIRQLISLVLSREGHLVESYSNAEEALKLIKKENIDLILLDWMLPGFSGIDFLLNVRQTLKKITPVLMVTAKTDPKDIVHALENGADDYVTKPFDPLILRARVNALLRRFYGNKSEPTIFELSELKLNLKTYESYLDNQPIHFTASEFKILVELIKNKGCVQTREHLISVVQGEGVSVTTRTIDTHVFSIRKKLGPLGDAIESIRSIGYRIKEI